MSSDRIKPMVKTEQKLITNAQSLISLALSHHTEDLNSEDKISEHMMIALVHLEAIKNELTTFSNKRIAGEKYERL